MPHDVNGTRIERGDWVKAKPINRKTYNKAREMVGELVVVGRVLVVNESQRCTGEVQWQSFGRLEQDYFDADESVVVLKADGSDPVSPDPPEA